MLLIVAGSAKEYNKIVKLLELQPWNNVGQIQHISHKTHLEGVNPDACTVLAYGSWYKHPSTRETVFTASKLNFLVLYVKDTLP